MPSIQLVVATLAGTCVCAMVGAVLGLIAAAVGEETGLVRHEFHYQSLAAGFNGMALGAALGGLSFLWLIVRRSPKRPSGEGGKRSGPGQ